MIFYNEKQLLNIIKYTPPLIIIAVMITVLSILYVENSNTFEEEKKKIEAQYIAQNKQSIKQRVQGVYDYIKREQKTTESALKKLLNLQLENAHTIMNTIYKNNQDKNEQEVKKLILDALRNIRFNDGRGYFFIYDKSGKNIMLPPVPKLEGTNFIQHKDSNGAYIIQDMLKLLSKQEKSFYEWYWYRPNDDTQQRKKIGLVKNFTPYNWFIGTGEYLEDFEKNVQERVLHNIREIRYGKSGYIFIINYDSIYLSHIRKDFIGQHALHNNDTIGIKKVISDLIDISKKGDGYYSYIQNLKPGINVATKKISYVKGLNDWSWMIGTGFYQDDLQTMIENKKREFDKKFNLYVKNTVSTTLLVTVLFLLISVYLSKKLQGKFKDYKKEIQQHLLENEQQHQMMTQQSKMASMGEMIGNIAHQWRQPLSTITITATGMQLQKEMQLLKDEDLENGLNNINNAAKHLSKTIDDFRNFFKDNKDKHPFNINDAINKSLKLVSVQFHNNNIELINQSQDMEVVSYENELIQVIVNILNNARDELIKKQTNERRLIFIDSHLNNNSVSIEIKDNAGGIPNNNISQVFNSNFSTKKDKDGTGIGLYMSREIIEKNIQGELSVLNTSYTYENQNYKGAKFTVTIPL